MTAKARRKPAATWPLFPHGNGQWAKKIRGRLRYFGTDKDAAFARYQREYADLMAGREPRAFADGLTLRELCNAFLKAKEAVRDAGEMSPRTWRDYYDTCGRLVDAFGRETVVAALTVPDFERLRGELAKTLGPVALANTIQRVRTTFKYAFEAGLVPAPVRFGPTFRKPSKKEMRKADQARGLRIFAAADVRAVLDAADRPMRAMILLGVNCGHGNTDVASLPIDALDLAGGWVDFPRPKTAIPRRCPLWPETVAALRAVIARRPKAKARADAGLVFLTKYGHRWVRTEAREGDKRDVATDAVYWQFAKLLQRLGLRGSFYDLRRTFRTVGDNARDREAIEAIMGHVESGVTPNYLRRIDDARLRAVTDLVHAWLWPPAEPAKPSA